MGMDNCKVCVATRQASRGGRADKTAACVTFRRKNLAFLRIAKQVSFGAAWVALLVSTFIVTTAFWDDFPKSEGKVAGCGDIACGDV